ncbi:uncharacterized protein G2W53_009764 [Senna tora]|uniref:Uncharacterized protein n=1 Tax=Senna tora TaxID=362788 RepID=A0A834WY25_9FABA|nr:uncharacterized protein G2W53_009764 [Senna tora]
MTRQKTCCASESNTSVLVVFANGSGLMSRLESSWHGRSVDHVLTYSGRQIAVGSQKPSRITRQKTCCASDSNTSVRVVFANGSGFDVRLESSWHGRSVGHVLTYSGRQIAVGFSETFTNYEAKDLLRKSVDLVLTYSGRQITVGISETFTNYAAKDLCASESNTSVRVVFANPEVVFDALIGVVLAWEERGSCLNIFRTTNRDLELRNLHELRGKRLVVQVSQTRRFACIREREWFRCSDWSRLGMGGAWIMLNIFRTKNSGRISETFTNYEAKRLVAQVSQTRRESKNVGSRTGVVFDLRLESSWHGRSVDHVLTYSGRQSRSDLRTFTNYEAKDLLRKLVKHVGSRTGLVLMLRLESSWHGRSDEEYDMESTQGWKTNTLKDPLQGIGDPMTRARSKAMKVALNCFRRDLKELEPNYIKESTITCPASAQERWSQC